MARPVRLLNEPRDGARSFDGLVLRRRRRGLALDHGEPAAVGLRLESFEGEFGRGRATRVVDHPLEVAGTTWPVTATSMGNPHCAVFLDTVAQDALLHELGPRIERHPFFPKRTNVEFVTVVSRSEIRVRFWERGVGYTMASGTGSASAAVASIVTGRAARKLRAVCDGGTLEIEWPEGGSVRQTAEAEVLYEGDWIV